MTRERSKRTFTSKARDPLNIQYIGKGYIITFNLLKKISEMQLKISK